MAKKISSPRVIGKGVFWNPRFQTNCRVIYIYIYQRQKQSLSYASPLVVYWDPLHDHSWNDKVCHESLSQCQSNLSSSSKLKNSIFGVVKVN